MDVIMHLFHCVTCQAPMADKGRANDERCMFCLADNVAGPAQPGDDKQEGE